MQLQARLTFQDGAERGSLMQLARLEYEEKEKKKKKKKKKKEDKIAIWEGAKLYNTCCFPLISYVTPLRYPLNHSESPLVDSQ
jgi:hypothetical protein